jgi:hypothetical protein
MKYMRGKGKKGDDLFKINKLANMLLSGLFEIERVISKGVPLPIGTSLVGIAMKK